MSVIKNIIKQIRWFRSQSKSYVLTLKTTLWERIKFEAYYPIALVGFLYLSRKEKF